MFRVAAGNMTSMPSISGVNITWHPSLELENDPRKARQRIQSDRVIEATTNATNKNKNNNNNYFYVSVSPKAKSSISSSSSLASGSVSKIAGSLIITWQLSNDDKKRQKQKTKQKSTRHWRVWIETLFVRLSSYVEHAKLHSQAPVCRFWRAVLRTKQK